MDDTLWLVIAASLVVVIFAGFFIATVIVNQKRFIKVQEEKLRESIRLQEVLRERPRQIIKAQEEERRRVARDLHDGTSQMLSSIMYNVHAIKGLLATSDQSLSNEVTELVDTVTRDCERTLDELKGIAHNLRPKMFDELGFDAAARSLLGDFSKRTNITVEYFSGNNHTPDTSAFPQEIGLGMFRILQEALTNIEKHSKATSVTVTSIREKSLCQLVLVDNGRGLHNEKTSVPPEDRVVRSGLGLISMRERAELLGGRCEILANNPAGTRIIVEIPLESIPHAVKPE